MAAISGQPSPKPVSLGSPVPNEAAQLSADDFMASFDAPPVAAVAPPQEASLSADDFLASVDQPAAQEFAPEPSALQANLEQFNPKNFIDRLQAGLASNDNEKANFLKKKYGDENVAVKNGNLYYRRDPKDKMKRLDPAAFELISDILPDFAREIVTEGALAPSEIMGGAIGSAVAPGVGTAGGAIAGRVATLPMANAMADQVADWAGVPQDESRNIRQENMIGQAAEGLLPVVGKKVAGQIAKRIPGTAAYKVAREAGEREVVALSKQSREVLDASAQLEQEGIKIPLMLQQVQPDSPKVKALVDSVADSGQFINKQTEFAEGYGAALENNLHEIARRTNKGPVAPEKLASTITNAVESLDRAEGQAIGKFRAQATAKLGNKKQPLPPEVQQNVSSLMKQFGFKFRSNPEGKVSIVPPTDLRPLVGTRGLTKTGEVRSVVNALHEIGKTQQSGGARLTDLDRIVSVVGDLNPKLRSSAFGGEWGALTGSLRQHRRNTIVSGLDDEIQAKAFNDVMDDYSLLRQNTEQLSNVLRGDVTTKTVVNSFFKGKENLANIRALKSITGKDSPEWGALKGEFIDQLMLKHASDGPTGFNSKAFLNDLEKNYGSDFIKEVFNDGKVGPDFATIKNLLTVGKRIEATTKGLKADSLDETRKKGIINTLVGLVSGMRFKQFGGIQSLLGTTGSKENVMMEILNRDGWEKYIANYRGPGNKKDISEKIQGMLQNYNKTRAAVRAGSSAVKRGTKAEFRQDLQQSDQQLPDTP